MKHLRTSLAAAALVALPAGAVFGADAPTAGQPAVPGVPPAGQPAAENKDLLTIEVSEKPLDIVLQWISRRAGINVVCNEAEQPKVTMRLVNVGWQDAVNQICTKYDLVLEKRSDAIWELTKPPKVRMQFQDARLTVILEALARQAGVNIVISDKVNAERRLTMTLQGVPWREALDVIVRATGYVWIEQKYKIIRIVTPGDVQKDLQTRVYRLNYTKGETAKSLISVALSGDGKVIHDQRTNSLILTDTPVNLDAATRILEELDRRTQEVQIEMKFVEFSVEDALNFGFSGAMNLGIDNFGTVATSFFPFSTAAGRFLGSGPSDPANSGIAVPTTTSTRLNSGGLTFEALSTLTSTEVIQTPNVLTLNNEPASIEITEKIRYAETKSTSTDAGTETTLEEAENSPVDIGIQIKVTPHITNDGFVIMEMNASDKSNQFRKFYAEESTESKVLELPQIREKKIDTKIMVADGETAVIGGILSDQTAEIDTRVPVLGSIPVLGWLFRSKDEKVTQRNLTIFVTPRIIQTDNEALEDAKVRLRERLSGLKLRTEEGKETNTLGQ